MQCSTIDFSTHIFGNRTLLASLERRRLCGAPGVLRLPVQVLLPDVGALRPLRDAALHHAAEGGAQLGGVGGVLEWKAARWREFSEGITTT